MVAGAALQYTREAVIQRLLIKKARHLGSVARCRAGMVGSMRSPPGMSFQEPADADLVDYCEDAADD